MADTDTKSPLHAHLYAKGPMTRKNPELQRLARATGYSAEHLFGVALGRRASRACAMAIVKHTRNPAISVDGLVAGKQ
jgi:hypothetical protein